MNPIIRMFVILLSVLTASIVSAADYPAPTEGDFTIRDFKFASGETLAGVAHPLSDARDSRRRMRRAKRQMRF